MHFYILNNSFQDIHCHNEPKTFGTTCTFKESLLVPPLRCKNSNFNEQFRSHFSMATKKKLHAFYELGKSFKRICNILNKMYYAMQDATEIIFKDEVFQPSKGTLFSS